MSDATGKLNDLLNSQSLNKNFAADNVPQSISISKTRSDLSNAQAQSVALEALISKCTGDGADEVIQAARTTQARVTTIADAVGRATGTFSCDAVLQPNTDYTISVWEKYQGITTNKCTGNGDGKKAGVSCDIAYKPVSTTVTMSAGFLFSTIPVRTYERRNVPGSTDAEMIVNNSGPVNIALTALVNVKIPWDIPHICPLNDDSFGCAVSVGPAYMLGTGSQQASNFGLFTGFSIQAWRYLYITPGVQIAQYNNFPAGFGYSGQPVPPSFTGNLQPVVKTTAKFGIAVTFKGWDIVKAAKQIGAGKAGSQ